VLEMQCHKTMQCATSSTGEFLHCYFCTSRFSICQRSHSMERDDIKQGVHYTPVGVHEYSVVEMVVTLKEPPIRERFPKLREMLPWGRRRRVGDDEFLDTDWWDSD